MGGIQEKWEWGNGKGQPAVGLCATGADDTGNGPG